MWNFTGEKKEGITFSQILLGVFTIMDQDITSNLSMPMSTFFELKDEALKKVKKWQISNKS